MMALLKESTVPLLSDDEAQLGRASRRCWGSDKLMAQAVFSQCLIIRDWIIWMARAMLHPRREQGTDRRNHVAAENQG